MDFNLDYEIKCSVCGVTSEQHFYFTFREFATKELDTRPYLVDRNIMSNWISKCPCCGYVSQTLKDELEINPDYLESDEYKTCDGIDFKSDLSKSFYKKYMIEKKKSKDFKSVFEPILWCSWACEDDYDIPNAILARRIGIELIEQLPESYEEYDNFIVLKSELLRRCWEFDRVIEEYENLTLNDELYDKIIKFEVKKAHEKDPLRYALHQLK